MPPNRDRRVAAQQCTSLNKVKRQIARNWLCRQKMMPDAWVLSDSFERMPNLCPGVCGTAHDCDFLRLAIDQLSQSCVWSLEKALGLLLAHLVSARYGNAFCNKSASLDFKDVQVSVNVAASLAVFVAEYTRRLRTLLAVPHALARLFAYLPPP